MFSVSALNNSMLLLDERKFIVWNMSVKFPAALVVIGNSSVSTFLATAWRLSVGTRSLTCPVKIAARAPLFTPLKQYELPPTT